MQKLEWKKHFKQCSSTDFHEVTTEHLSNRDEVRMFLVKIWDKVGDVRAFHKVPVEHDRNPELFLSVARNHYGHIVVLFLVI